MDERYLFFFVLNKLMIHFVFKCVGVFGRGTCATDGSLVFPQTSHNLFFTAYLQIQ